MAPSTNIGAASPVTSTGEDHPETLEAKATEAAAAFIRSIAEERGRNADALEGTVVEAKAYAASEALDNNMIDLVAKDVDGLIEALDGRKVQLERGEYVLATAGIPVTEIDPTPLERFLNFLSDPNIAFLLMSLGTLGTFIEVLSPGLVGPRRSGGHSPSAGLRRAGQSTRQLGRGCTSGLYDGLVLRGGPSTWVRVLRYRGGGELRAGGVLSVWRDHGAANPHPQLQGEPVAEIVGVSAATFAFVAFVVRDLVAARRSAFTRQPSSRSLVGQVGVVSTEISPRGSVHVAGEEWSAVSDSET